MSPLKSKLKPDQRLWVQLIRYFFVGGTSTLVHLGIFTLLSKVFGLHYLWVAQPIGFCFGLMVNYSIAIHFVFPNRSVANVWKERFLYFLTALMGFVIDSILLFLLVDKLDLDPSLSKVISAGITFIWNFFSKKLFLFK